MAHARSRGLSQRRARALLSTSRSSLHYTSRLEARDKPLMTAMKGLGATYTRFGYRRINVFMERLGHVMGADRAFRLWFKAGLQEPMKRPRQPTRIPQRHRALANKSVLRRNPHRRQPKSARIQGGPPGRFFAILSDTTPPDCHKCHSPTLDTARKSKISNCSETGTFGTARAFHGFSFGGPRHYVP